MTVAEIRFPLAADKVGDICRGHGIRRLSLFGSVLRDDFGTDSDIDVLVEFEPERTPRLSFFAIARELESQLGRTVDLHTPASLSACLRDEVLAEALTVHVSRDVTYMDEGDGGDGLLLSPPSPSSM